LTPALPTPAPSTPASPIPPAPAQPRTEQVWLEAESPAEDEGAEPPVVPVVAFPEPAWPFAALEAEDLEAEDEAEVDAAEGLLAEPEPITASDLIGAREPITELEPVAEAEPVAEPVAEEEPAGALSPVERCYELYETKRFPEVDAVGTAALQGFSRGVLLLKPHEVARLWGVVGLARREVGDYEGARAAFEEAITGAPRRERESWERHLASLALQVGRELLSHAENPGLGDGGDRVTQVSSAIVWFERGLAVAADDESLRAAAAAAQAALWPTYEEVTVELIQRQEYAEARRSLRQALGDPRCPADLQATFRDLLSGTYSGEVGQLTAEALRRMQEGKEVEALATLDRAEELLAATPEEGLTERRRQELERRLWWSYTKVGIRRLEAGLPEDALEPLLRALRFASVGAGRLDETRRPLARALESVVEARAMLIERLDDGGDRTEAAAHCEQLWETLEKAMARGMTREELAAALSRVEALFDRLEGPEA
jgi:tetratricopeptide (TPR) repeat protein